MLQWFSRIVLGVLVVILLGVSIGLYLVWAQTRREYQTFAQKHAETELRLQNLQAERDEKEAYLRAFLSDPEFVERVVRTRLGYVAPGELVFRYESGTTTD